MGCDDSAAVGTKQSLEREESDKEMATFVDQTIIVLANVHHLLRVAGDLLLRLTARRADF